MAEMTIARAAVALGVNVATVRWRIECGTLKARRTIGGRWLVILPDEAAGQAEAPGKRLERMDALLEEAQFEVARQTHLLGDLSKILSSLQEKLRHLESDTQGAAGNLAELRVELEELARRPGRRGLVRQELPGAEDLPERAREQVELVNRLLEGTAEFQMRLANARDGAQRMADGFSELAPLL